jgi:hypothetical protein
MDPVKVKKFKWGWYIVDFCIFKSSGGSDITSTFTMIFLFLSLILSPFFYYEIKDKITVIKNSTLRAIIAGIVIIFISLFFIFFFGKLLDRILL